MVPHAERVELLPALVFAEMWEIELSTTVVELFS